MFVTCHDRVWWNFIQAYEKIFQPKTSHWLVLHICKLHESFETKVDNFNFESHCEEIFASPEHQTKQKNNKKVCFTQQKTFRCSLALPCLRIVNELCENQANKCIKLMLTSQKILEMLLNLWIYSRFWWICVLCGFAFVHDKSNVKCFWHETFRLFLIFHRFR